MKIVKTGPIARIFPDDLETYDALPVATYKIGFDSMSGFYLEVVDDLVQAEVAYGNQSARIEKVRRHYAESPRSTGVLLSGPAGMGKSMTARAISESFAREFGMPTVLISNPYVGVSDFIESIKQEAVILFDEFDKVFTNKGALDQERSYGERERPQVGESQDKLLGLFDGISQTKRIYVVTVNDTSRVNQFMLGRPGRFHYHFRYDTPSKEEIGLYLADKLEAEFQHQIPKVQNFCTRSPLNYDALRAISEDLNKGYDFLDTIQDINISTEKGVSSRYQLDIHMSNNEVTRESINLNLMNNRASFNFWLNDHSDYIQVEFSPLQIEIHDRSEFIANEDEVTFDLSFGSENDVYTDESGITISKILFKEISYNGPKYGKEVGY